MGIHVSDHPDVPGMKGLHLFHFAMSNCSQRVRLALQEKGLSWTSYHLNLAANEHVTADYQRINPNGVVPTLVHDGQVIIDSNDILLYLDEQFPEPALRPANQAAREAMNGLIGLSSDFQGTIKVLSHELLFKAFRKIGPEELALFEREHPDHELVKFLRDFSEDGVAWKARVEQAQADLTRVLDLLEGALGEAAWLSGDAYGLADISWVVNANRLIQTRLDLGPWPRLQAWAKRVMQRPAFDAAVASYAP